MKQLRDCVLVGLTFALAILPVFPSGFSIYEQSAKASAQAGAWTARADDAAANVRAVIEAQALSSKLHARWMGVDIASLSVTGGGASTSSTTSGSISSRISSSGGSSSRLFRLK